MFRSSTIIYRLLRPSSLELNCFAPALKTRLLTSQIPETSDNLQASNQSTDLLLPQADRDDFFRLKNLFTIEQMIESRVHFGHKEGRLGDHMRPYIFGKRLGVLLIDLDKTAPLLNKALHVAAEIAYRDGIVLFISNSRQNGLLVEETAKECGEFAHCRKWSDQVFANSQKIFGAVTRLPDLVIVFNVIGELEKTHSSVVISSKMLIPTIGICDTDCDPRLVTYPVPGNDDSPQSVEFYCKLFKTAILNGKAKRKEIIEKYGEEFYNKTIS